jgi:gamma-glutamyl:cysteine ligase YbdK (ATP-grasp superfamily)
MKSKLHLFQAYGIELEYMIVDKDTLAVKPITDELLKQELGKYGSDFENGRVTWSNELVLHVVELKCTQPESDLSQLEREFTKNIQRVNKILSQWNAMLLPSAAHPFMNPHEETKLWPHDNNEVYAIYNKIFDCSGHGWSNLQSTHLNLPFANDEEFGRLHAAIRLVLPLLPALCASSPILDGKLSGYQDTRLTFYKTNQAKIPSITGSIIPESVYTEKDHEEIILKKIESDIASYNHEGILDPVWVNSRGAMSRFDRGSIEIRIMDIQECPAADLAIVMLVIETLKALVAETWASFDMQKSMGTEKLASLLGDCIKHGQKSVISDSEYLKNWKLTKPVTAKELWQIVFDQLLKSGNTELERWKHQLSLILKEGTLSDRLVKALGANPNQATIENVYQKLGTCLADNTMFA